MFLLVAIGSMLANFAKFGYFGVAGEKLTTRLRKESFKKMLRLEISWFDQEKNSVGALTSSLSSGAQQVQFMSGSILGNLMELGVTFAVTAVVALSYGWELALVVLACLPLLVFANKMRMDIMRKGNVATKAYYEASAQIACEAVGAIRTIAALTREKNVLEMYCHELEVPIAIGVHHAIYSTVWFAISQSLSFLVNAVAFYFGTYLFINNNY